MNKNNYNYMFDSQIKKDIGVINEILKKIKEPMILSYCDIDSIELYISNDNNFIWDNELDWLIYDWYKSNTIGIRERILEISIEDIEWTEKRNKGLECILYRKVSFKKDALKAITEHLTTFKNELELLLIKKEIS